MCGLEIALRAELSPRKPWQVVIPRKSLERLFKGRGMWLHGNGWGQWSEIWGPIQLKKNPDENPDENSDENLDENPASLPILS